LEVITGEYGDPYYRPFYEIGAHLPHAIKQTNFSNDSCSPSGKLFWKKASSLAIKIQIITKKSARGRQSIDNTRHDNSRKKQHSIAWQEDLALLNTSTNNNAKNR